MSKQHFIVEGFYDDEPQITCDSVLAENEEEATDLVRKVRDLTCHSGGWMHDLTTTPLARLEEMVKALKETDAEVEAGWEQTKTDLGYRECKRCHKGCDTAGDDFDEDQELCGNCIADACKTCGGPGASGDGAYDGECPTCADRTAKNDANKCAAAGCEEPLVGELLGFVEGNHQYCTDKCRTATERADSTE